MKTYLDILKKGKDLSVKESEEVMTLMMNGNFLETDAKDFLTLLGKKGESINEIYGMASIMRDFSLKVNIDKRLMDNCGTGGSGKKRINTSTISAFLLSACGVNIAKHGNKAQSGRVGSFDLLEKLGIKINLNPREVEKIIEKTNLGFIYARLFHPSMKNIAEIRKEMKSKTIFNILGPLSNPATPKFQILGVSDIDDGRKMIEVLKKLSVSRALVCYGQDGLDEITVCGKTNAYELRDGEVKSFEINPEDYGIKIVTFSDICGGDIEDNKEIAIKILKGLDYKARTDLIVINSAFALYIYGLVDSVKEGVEMAKEFLYTGKAYDKLEQYRDISNSKLKMQS